jgi:hypothetical protein
VRFFGDNLKATDDFAKKVAKVASKHFPSGHNNSIAVVGYANTDNYEASVVRRLREPLVMRELPVAIVLDWTVTAAVRGQQFLVNH